MGRESCSGRRLCSNSGRSGECGAYPGMNNDFGCTGRLHREGNQEIYRWQSEAPRGYVAIRSPFMYLAGVPGFEPGNAGIKIRCLTAWRYPNEERTFLATGTRCALMSCRLDRLYCDAEPVAFGGNRLGTGTGSIFGLENTENRRAAARHQCAESPIAEQPLLDLTNDRVPSDGY